MPSHFLFERRADENENYRNDPKFSDRQAWPGQTVQTQIRLLLESDQGLHCLLFHHLDSYSMVEPHSSNFKVITTNILGVRIFRKFTVIKKYSHPTMHHVYLLGAASTAEIFTTMTINKVRRMSQN